MLKGARGEFAAFCFLLSLPSDDWALVHKGGSFLLGPFTKMPVSLRSTETDLPKNDASAGLRISFNLVKFAITLMLLSNVYESFACS